MKVSVQNIFDEKKELEMKRNRTMFAGAVLLFVGIVLIVLALPLSKAITLGILWGSGFLLFVALLHLTKRS